MKLFHTLLAAGFACGLATPALADEGLHPFAAEIAGKVADPEQPFILVVEFVTKEGEAEAFLANAAEPRRETAKEPGNVAYELSRSVEDPAKFLLYEHWKSVAALDSHLKQPYLTKLLASFEATLAEPPKLTVFTPSPAP